MIITKEMMDKKVPKETFPTRLDSATDLYTYTDEGLILYNIKPTTWNVLYPFFEQNNKFTKDNFDIENKDITYGELIDIYKNIYTKEYEIEKGFDEEKRKSVLVEEFNENFKVENTKISQKLDSHYELKYSKSQNVYTLYYLESYVANKISNLEKLLNQDVFQQKFLCLDDNCIPDAIDGIKLVDSLSLLNDKNKRDILKNNLIKPD